MGGLDLQGNVGCLAAPPPLRARGRSGVPWARVPASLPSPLHGAQPSAEEGAAHVDRAAAAARVGRVRRRLRHARRAPRLRVRRLRGLDERRAAAETHQTGAPANARRPHWGRRTLHGALGGPIRTRRVRAVRDRRQAEVRGPQRRPGAASLVAAAGAFLLGLAADLGQ